MYIVLTTVYCIHIFLVSKSFFLMKTPRVVHFMLLPNLILCKNANIKVVILNFK